MEKPRFRAPMKPESSADSEVGALREQLGLLASEISSIRASLPPQHRASLTSLEHRPPLPPRRYRGSTAMGPEKPARTFKQGASVSTGDLRLKADGIFGLADLMARNRAPPPPLATSSPRQPPPPYLLSPAPPLPPRAKTVVSRMSSQGSDSDVLPRTIIRALRNGQTGPLSPARISIGSNEAARPLDLDTRKSLSRLRAQATTAASLTAELAAGFASGLVWFQLGPLDVLLNPFNDLGAADVALPRGLSAAARLTTAALHHQSQAILVQGASGSGKSYVAGQLMNGILSELGGGEVAAAFHTSQHLLHPFISTALSESPASSAASLCYEVQVSGGQIYRTKTTAIFSSLSQLTDPSENNYRIFYLMLAGLTKEEKAKFHLLGVRDFAYLGGDGWASGLGGRESGLWAQWRSALSRLGIPFSDVVRVLAAVLLLGNLDFHTSPDDPDVHLLSQKEVDAVSALLGVSPAALYRALVSGPPTAKRNTAAAAKSGRDALARSLYQRTLVAVMRRGNSISAQGLLNATPPLVSSGISSDEGDGSVQDSGIELSGSKSSSNGIDGSVFVIDACGFSHSKESRFDDLCRTYAAEKMVEFTRKHLSESRLAATPELIPVNMGDSDIANMSQIFTHLRQEDSAKGVDTEKLASHLSSPSSASVEDGSLLVSHWGGAIGATRYPLAPLCAASADVVPAALVRLFGRPACNFGFASFLFGPELAALAQDPARPLRAMPSATLHARNYGSSWEEKSLGEDFVSATEALLGGLGECRVQSIVCLKTNANCEYRQLDPAVLEEQVRIFALHELANAASSGLPYFLSFGQFNARYRFLMRQQRPEIRGKLTPKEEAGVILESYLAAVDESSLPYTPNQWLVEADGVALSLGAQDQLETLREAEERRPPKPDLSPTSRWVLHSALAQAKAGLPSRKLVADSTRNYDDVHDDGRADVSSTSSGRSGGDSLPPLPPSRQYSIFGNRRINFTRRSFLGNLKGSRTSGTKVRAE